MDSAVPWVIYCEQTWQEEKRAEREMPRRQRASGLTLESFGCMLIWKPGQRFCTLQRRGQDSATEQVIPNQLNRATDDSSPGVCSSERIAVIAGTWQRNQAPASSPLGCLPWGPQFRDPPRKTWLSELSQANPCADADRSPFAYGLNFG